MKREILFRGKHKNRMVSGDYFFDPFLNKHFIKALTEGGTILEDLEVDPSTVGQLSPFKAKGVSLFVGDQITTITSRGHKITHTLVSVFEILNPQGEVTTLRQSWIDECGFELSGNIHDK